MRDLTTCEEHGTIAKHKAVGTKIKIIGSGPIGFNVEVVGLEKLSKIFTLQYSDVKNWEVIS